MHKIIVDNKIPFMKGRLEPFAEVVYAAPTQIDRDMVKDADALVVRTRTKCDKSLLEGSKVKLVATATIGTDHIDEKWCGENGIKVRNAAGCNAPGVAQYVWASLLRNGFDPQTHTLGIVGHGNVGSIVAQWGNQMGCKILISDPPKEKENKDGIPYVSLEELLLNSDAVTLHVPLTFSGEYPTSYMISQRELEMMKPSSFLVNAARGGVVDENALLKAIDERGIKALTDVWENEPLISTHLLEKSLVATPHIAGYSLEGKSRATHMVLNALEEELGISIDKSGLEAPWKPSATKATAKVIRDSYNPSVDTEMLRSQPADFEKLRENYELRKEPLNNS